MNYSVTGFQLVLTRKMSFYVVTYYLPSGLFVVVSWIRSGLPMFYLSSLHNLLTRDQKYQSAVQDRAGLEYLLFQLSGEPRDNPWENDPVGDNIPGVDQHPQHDTNQQSQGETRTPDYEYKKVLFKNISLQAEGLTAIECWVIACIIFVFGALLEYTVILLKLKLKKVRASKRESRQQNGAGGAGGATNGENETLVANNGKSRSRKKSATSGILN